MRFVWLKSPALRECAFERLDQALSLLDSGRTDVWPLAAYASGVAVECAIRAKLKVVATDFNSGHRLAELATEAGYGSHLKGENLERFNADLKSVDQLWDNLLRYCSAEAYVEFLNRRSVRIGTGHGRLKASELAHRVGDQASSRTFAEETYNGAARLVRYGEYFWRNR